MTAGEPGIQAAGRNNARMRASAKVYVRCRCRSGHRMEPAACNCENSQPNKPIKAVTRAVFFYDQGARSKAYVQGRTRVDSRASI